MSGTFYVVGTPIGNLKEISFRAIEVLKSVDQIFCEDTRRSIKLLNAYEIKKPLHSAPYFKEQRATEEIETCLSAGRSVAFITDAGMPGLSDPGGIVVGNLRRKGFKIEVVGGVSSLTSFIAGLGVELETFRFLGFLPARVKDREALLSQEVGEPWIFFESPHRIESTIDLLAVARPSHRLVLAKELSKISESFFDAEASEMKRKISSFKGEWIGCLFPSKISISETKKRKKDYVRESDS